MGTGQSAPIGLCCRWLEDDAARLPGLLVGAPHDFHVAVDMREHFHEAAHRVALELPAQQAGEVGLADADEGGGRSLR